MASKALEIESRVVAWRRHFHQNPELSNREFKTASFIAGELKKLGLVVEETVGRTGVVGLLTGDQPGKTVALRADMDGLPVAEATNLPYASKARGQYEGRAVNVMHACGHDNHMAILLGAAEVLSGFRGRLKGQVKFIFQPVEKGAP